MDKKKLTTLFLIVFVDLLGFGIILPLLPYIAEKYQATPFVVGLLTASYAAAQLFGTPVLGRLSDRYGRKPILLLSLLGTLIGFVILGFSDELGTTLALALALPVNLVVMGILFISRTIDGLTGGNISIAQAYISDVTDDKNRASGLGMIGAAFGLGFIFGPVLGGFLSTFGYAVPAFAAAGLSAINLILVIAFLPESLPKADRINMASQNQRPALSLRNLLEALRRQGVGEYLHIRFFYGLAFAIFQTIFALYAQIRLNLDARSTGYLLGYVGILISIVQGGLVGRLAKRYPDSNLILFSTFAMTAALFAWAVTPSVPVLMIVLIPLSVAGGILNTVLSSALSKSVARDEIGGILGLSSSVESATRVIAPTLGGFLLGQVGTWMPGLFAGFLMIWVSSFTWRKFFNGKKPNVLPAQ